MNKNWREGHFNLYHQLDHYENIIQPLKNESIGSLKTLVY